jgi:hypothetical protein
MSQLLSFDQQCASLMEELDRRLDPQQTQLQQLFTLPEGHCF